MDDKTFGYEWPAAHTLGREEIDLVAQVVANRSPCREYGPRPQGMCEQFEYAFRDFVGVKHALGVNSGTSALNVAMAALQIGPGHEVIVPGYMWISVISAVVHRGAIPVLCEIDDSFCLDPADLERKITSRTRAVVHVHMNGATGNIDKVRHIAQTRGLKLIEDCAQAVGGSFGGRRLGSFGDVAIFSFQFAKAMSTGEGGMIVTDDDELYLRCLAIHDVGYAQMPQGVATKGPIAPVATWGLGVMMTELQGALGVAQLRKLPTTIQKMGRAKARLIEALTDVPGIRLRRVDDKKGDIGAFLITLYRDEPTAAAMARSLIALGLRSGPGGRLVHHLPDWGFHLYYNIEPLVRKTGLADDGIPWTHPLNHASQYDYQKGALPQSDALMARAVVQAIPANCADNDVDAMVDMYRQSASLIGL
jgi:8-amino-3,8-dideoxy-alpha-D-manno-octulosonate transaminase